MPGCAFSDTVAHKVAILPSHVMLLALEKKHSKTLILELEFPFQALFEHNSINRH